MKLMRTFLTLVFPAILVAGDTDITAYHRQTFGGIEYNRHGVAHIVTQDGWIAINRSKKILYKPFLYDNGPDYASEGMLRFVENGKMGFVNEAGKKVIKAQFDFVFPFEKGIARFCNGCRQVQDGEHTRIDQKSGTWGVVDKRGKTRRL